MDCQLLAPWLPYSVIITGVSSLERYSAQVCCNLDPITSLITTRHLGGKVLLQRFVESLKTVFGFMIYEIYISKFLVFTRNSTFRTCCGVLVKW